VTASPRRLAALFVLLSAIPVLALGWLGWRLLEMDRAVEVQRQRERLEAGADQFSRDLERTLAAWDAALTQPVAPPGTVILQLGRDGVVSRRGVPLPYYPQVRPTTEPPAELFAEAEAAEFRSEKSHAAPGMYKALAMSQRREVRAAALARLARALRTHGNVVGALEAYEALAAFGDTPVWGMPSELLARRERVVLLAAAGDQKGAQRETRLLGAALIEGRYLIDGVTYEYLRESAGVESVNTALAEAVQAASALWKQAGAGRRGWSGGDGSFVTVWRTLPRGTAAIVGSIDALVPRADEMIAGLHFSIEDTEGRRILGAAPAGVSYARRATDTGLPWTVRAAFVDPSAASRVAAMRRRLLVVGFAIVLLVIAAAGYVGYRAVSRELSVARLQSEFVATVSHEFRTPLTAMRHLTDLLEEGGVAPEKQPTYYAAIAKEVRRLHGMVESLLDFGRIESGRRTYQMEVTSAVDLARAIVEEVGSPRVVVDAPAASSRIRGDREALALALRNLVDNAIKYSPEASTVRVSVGTRGGFAAISVEDQGPGIARDEQRKVFRKFVRGAAARALNVKGTGIGLAMAEQIVRAHGGSLKLVSEPPRGSRFTILLPVHHA
jgi:two-component system phosphate regulon sensor histidine kinase PhoR